MVGKKRGAWQSASRTYSKGVGWSDNYPHGGPNEFSYTSSFYDYRPKTGMEAMGNLMAPSFGSLNPSINPQIIINLDGLIDRARQQELDYLNRHGFKLGNHADWGSLITGINRILSTSEIFERNIQLLKQYVDSEDSMTKDYRDITSLFGNYVQTAANQIISGISGRIADMTAADFDVLTEQIIRVALKNMLSETDYLTGDLSKGGKIKTHATNKDKEELEKLQAYAELLKFIDQIVSADFLKSVGEILHLKDFFIKTQQNIQYNVSHGLTKGKKGYKSQPSIYLKKQKGAMSGTVGEVIRSSIDAAMGGYSQTISNGVFSLALRVGQHGGKADRIQGSGTFANSQATVDFNLASNARGENQSNVVNSIDNFDKFMDQLDLAGAQGELVIISDKSYLINQMFEVGWDADKNGGFGAQDMSSLANIGDVLERVDSPVSPMDLMDYLSNCGDNMLLGNSQEYVMDSLASQIGAFLFNSAHITVSIPQGVNMINVMYLSGIYVPLSVILEGVKSAILNTLSGYNVRSFVEVQFQNGDTTPKHWVTLSEWEEFRLRRLNTTKLRITFLKDFAQFITDAVSGAF